MLTCISLLLLVGCQGNDDAPSVGMGYLSFGDVRVSADVEGSTRAFSLPDVSKDDFTIAIVNADGDTVSKSLYKEIDGTTMRVPASTYSIKAYYGSEKAISDSPYYFGETTATVEIEKETTASITSKLQSAVINPTIPANAHISNLKCVIAYGSETDSLGNGEIAYVLTGREYKVTLAGTNAAGAPISATINEKLSFDKPTVYYLSCSVKLSLTLPDQSNGAWAKRFYFTPIQTKDADGKSVNVPNITYQVYVNGEWKDADSDLCVTGLSTNTQYRVRAVTDGWTSDEQTVTTETETPINYQGTDCGDLEDWCSTAGPKYLGGGPYWYLYYPRATKDESSVEGWCTMNSYTTSISSNDHLGYIDNSGTMPTSECSHGSKAAEIATIGWGSGSVATSGGANNVTEGELFLGTISNYTPNYYYTLGTRPSAVEFYTQYKPVNSTSEYSVTFEVYDENKNLLASSTWSEDSISNYEKRTITLDYGSYKTTKAKYIKLRFASGSNTKDELEAVALVSNTWGRGVRHTGNKLYIDDVKLIYE